MLKTAEEIASEIVDNRMVPSYAPTCNPGELKTAIAQAILADRKERDERVIEVLEQLEGCDAIDCAMCQKRIEALLAELRKEKE